VAVTLWRWRDDVRVRCAAVGLVSAAVLSLGGRLWVGGVWTETRGPYAALQELPVVEASLASRLGLLTALFSAVLLGIAVDVVLRARVSWRRPAAVALAAACLLPILPRPLPTVEAPAVPEYFADAARYVEGDPVLVVLPYPWAGQPVAMRWQSESGYRFRMPGGYFLGPGPDGRAYVGGAADPATARLLTDVANEGVAAPVSAGDREQALADLREWQADAVVLGPGPSGDALRATVTALLGREPERVGGVDVWRLSP
jgi:dolichyl-phosphate beta-glucosyltransferase